MKNFLAQLHDPAGKALYRTNPKLYEELKADWPALVPTIRGSVAKSLVSNITAERARGNKIILRVANFTFLVGGKDTDSRSAPRGAFVVIVEHEDKDDWVRKSNLGVRHYQRVEQLIAKSALHKASKSALTKSEFASLVKVGALK